MLLAFLLAVVLAGGWETHGPAFAYVSAVAVCSGEDRLYAIGTGAVNRQQMAVFLSKALEGSDYVPLACTTATFDDVPCSDPFAPWVYELAARAISTGSSTGFRQLWRDSRKTASWPRAWREGPGSIASTPGISR